MNTWWQNLNLTPQERKFVIGVIIVFAVVLNLLFIWPQFKRWSPVEAERKEKQDLLTTYETKIAEMPTIQARLSTLETNSAPVMVSGDAAAHYHRTVLNLAGQVGLAHNGVVPPTVNNNSTNRYFQELSLKVNFTGAEEKDVVNFLYRLSDGNSTIRVREFSLSPDQTRMLLKGYLTLVANYEIEKPAARNAPAKNSTNLTAKTP